MQFKFSPKNLKNYERDLKYILLNRDPNYWHTPKPRKINEKQLASVLGKFEQLIKNQVREKKINKQYYVSNSRELGFFFPKPPLDYLVTPGSRHINPCQIQALAALSRLKKKSFGLCMECKSPISKARLKILPYARRCYDCQIVAEKIAKQQISVERPKRPNCNTTEKKQKANEEVSSIIRVQLPLIKKQIKEFVINNPETELVRFSEITGNEFRLFRERMNWSVNYFAKAVGLNPITLSKSENDSRLTSFMVTKLSNALFPEFMGIPKVNPVSASNNFNLCQTTRELISNFPHAIYESEVKKSLGYEPKACDYQYFQFQMDDLLYVSGENNHSKLCLKPASSGKGLGIFETKTGRCIKVPLKNPQPLPHKTPIFSGRYAGRNLNSLPTKEIIVAIKEMIAVGFNSKHQKNTIYRFLLVRRDIMKLLKKQKVDLKQLIGIASGDSPLKLPRRSETYRDIYTF